MQFPHRPEGEQDYFEFEDQLTEQRDEGRSPLIIFAAVAGLAVGLFLWGSIAFSAISGVTSIFDDDASPVVSEDAETTGDGAAPQQEDLVIDCDAFGPGRALSPEQEAAFQQQCLTPTPEPPEEDASTPADASQNREDCDEIRGTDYRSPEERQWFLANCVN